MFAQRQFGKMRGMPTPELTVAAIAERDGHFLMVEEWAGGRLVLNQPAGHVEPGEDFATAVVRETREETAWGFIPTAIVGIYHWQPPQGAGTNTLRTVFCGDCSDHAPQLPLDDGIVAAHWLTLEQLRAQQQRLRSPLVLEAIHTYLDGNRHPLDLLHTLASPAN